MRKLLIYIALLALTCLVAKAQQAPQWTQYVLNKYGVNPAYGGLEKSLSVTTGLRSQWSKFPGSPKTQMINAHLPLYFLNGSMGMTLVNDETGPMRRTRIALSYNYVYDSDIGLFSVGARFGGQQVNLNNSALRTPDGFYQDNSIDHQDPRLVSVNTQGFQPTLTLGAFYIKDLLEVGVSVDHFPSSLVEAGQTTFDEVTTLTVFGSYQYPITEQVSIEPNLLMKTGSGQTQVDIGVLGYYNDVFGGLSIRGYSSNTLDALGIIAGTRISKHVKFSYSFDLGLSGPRDFHDGTHEFIINYNLQRPIRTGELPRIIYNPRYR